MTGELFQANAATIDVILQRVGDVVTVKKADGTETTNSRGKVTDTDITWVDVDSETAHRIYGSDSDRPDFANVVGGRVDVDSPQVVFSNDTVAEAGRRVEFPDGNVYELDEKVPYETHTQFRSTLVNG